MTGTPPLSFFGRDLVIGWLQIRRATIRNDNV